MRKFFVSDFILLYKISSLLSLIDILIIIVRVVNFSPKCIHYIELFHSYT
jgi:hypothetical protein